MWEPYKRSSCLLKEKCKGLDLNDENEMIKSHFEMEKKSYKFIKRILNKTAGSGLVMTQI